MSLEREMEELQGKLAQVDLLAQTTTRPGAAHIGFVVMKRGSLKVKMYQEQRHKLPHIHVDYGRQNHVASYSIDPVVRLKGSLDRKYDEVVTRWIEAHRDMLLALWKKVGVGGKRSDVAWERAGSE